MAAKKKKASRRRVVVPPPTAEMKMEMHRYFLKQHMHEERRSAAIESAAESLRSIAQYVADYATRDRVQRLLPKG